MMMRRINLKRHEEVLAVAIAATVMVAAASTAAVFWYRQKSRNQDASPSSTTDDGPIPEHLEQTFLDSADRIRKLENPLSTGEKLVLYALYKQSTNGDAPHRFARFELGKSWGTVAAWNKLRGMPKGEAMARYIIAVKDIEANGGKGQDESQVISGAPTVSIPDIDNGGYDDRNDKTPKGKLLRAASMDDDFAVDEVLNGGDVAANDTDETGQTALHLAADRGSNKVVLKLLEHGADPNTVDNDGISVLQAAVIAGNVETARLLLEKGADPNQADHDGDTPKTCAEDEGDGEMKRLFFNDTENQVAD
jgi:acyl-CoA-binding protein